MDKTLILVIVGDDPEDYKNVRLIDVADIDFDPNNNEHEVCVSMDNGDVHYCDMLIIT